MARILLILALTPFLCGCAPSEDAPEANTAEEISMTPVEEGEQLYVQYCQSCHGTEAKGDGPLAELLRIPPPDLTLIAERNGDVFPVDEVVSYIDGRNVSEGHGTRNMPVWGNVWTDEVGGAEAEQAMARQIDMLVEYLRTLQEDIPDA